MARRLSTIAVTIAALAALAACTPTRTQKTAGEQLDDTVVTTRVKTALAKDLGSDALKIDVETYRGKVQLNGFINSADAKSKATTVARNVTGVTDVDNNLSLAEGKRSAGEYVDDKVIASKVKAGLAGDSEVAAHEVNVEVREGVVQLAGFVDNTTEKSRAGDIARRVAGVKDVENKLAVKQR